LFGMGVIARGVGWRREGWVGDVGGRSGREEGGAVKD